MEDHTLQPILAKPNDLLLEQLVETNHFGNLFIKEMVGTNHFGNLFVEESVETNQKVTC